MILHVKYIFLTFGTVGSILVIIFISLYLGNFFVINSGCFKTNDDDEMVWFTKIDKEGNLYLYGITGTIDFPYTINLTNTYSRSPVQFVMKYTPARTLEWSIKYSKSIWDIPTALKVDNNGNIIIAGTWRQSDTAFTSFFITKFSGEGALLFEKTIGGEEFDDNPLLEVSESNSIYLLGRITNQYPTGQTYGQTEHQLLTKLNENGTIIYSKSYTTAFVESIAIDSKENIY